MNFLLILRISGSNTLRQLISPNILKYSGTKIVKEISINTDNLIVLKIERTSKKQSRNSSIYSLMIRLLKSPIRNMAYGN